MRSGRREKELASDRRAGWSARASIRVRHRETFRTQWRLLSALAGAVLAVVAVAAIFATGPLQRGVILGAGVATAACMVTGLVVLTSGTAPLMMGEIAEQWTAQELRPLMGHSWKLVNHFGLSAGDQDHVLVGPGGVVLVEAKWGGTPWDADAGNYACRQALAQTARNAKQLAAWHGVARHGHPEVEAVLAVWGPAGRKLRELPVRRHESGVVVMSGDQVQRWMLSRGRDRLVHAQIDGIFADIDRHLVRRDQHERSRKPMPRSLPEMARSVSFGIALSIGGFLLTAQVLELTGSLIVWLASALSLVLAAEWVYRRTRWRWEARSCEVGLSSLYGLTGVAIVRAFL